VFSIITHLDVRVILTYFIEKKDSARQERRDENGNQRADERFPRGAARYTRSEG
jgi:hypothetical protein